MNHLAGEVGVTGDVLHVRVRGGLLQIVRPRQRELAVQAVVGRPVCVPQNNQTQFETKDKNTQPHLSSWPA